MSTDTTNFQLPESLEISRIGELTQQLSGLDGSSGGVVLDGSLVTRIDTAAMQLLLAFWRKHAESGGKIRWHAPSEALRRAACLLGMDTVIGITDISSASMK